MKYYEDSRRVSGAEKVICLTKGIVMRQMWLDHYEFLADTSAFRGDTRTARKYRKECMRLKRCIQRREKRLSAL